MKIKFKWNKYISDEDTMSKLYPNARGVAIVRQRYQGKKDWEYSAELFEIDSDMVWLWDVDFNEGQEECEILYWADWYGLEVEVKDTASEKIEEIE